MKILEKCKQKTLKKIKVINFRAKNIKTKNFWSKIEMENFQEKKWNYQGFKSKGKLKVP